MKPYIRLIPRSWVRFFARPYVAGDSLERAMDVAAALFRERRLATTLDLLAEGIEDPQTIDRNVAAYLDMVDAAASDARFPPEWRPTVSLKPSSYTLRPLDEGGDAAGSAAAVRRIVGAARERQVGVTIDMESRHWTDFTLDLVRALHAEGHDHVGAVLQTRLERTRADLDRLPAGLRVRLVIGIYAEPEKVAVTDKRVMKERLLEYAGLLLERGHYVEFATHDERYVRRFVTEVVPSCGAGRDRFEVQMLYGVPRERILRELVEDGVRCRLYVPFALGWAEAIAYLRRRLDEYPQMMFLVARNWLRRR